MIATIHQPEHMPWTGYFHKMAQCDVYVLLDDVQFKKNNWQNRNRIMDNQGKVQWLTVPILLKGHTSSTIDKTRINYSERWQKKYWGRLSSAYSKAPFYAEYADRIKDIVFADHALIVDLNIALIDFFRQVLGIDNTIVRSSQIETSGSRTELLVSICRAVDADTYITGPDGRTYMDMNLWEEAEVDVVDHRFTPPVYDCPNFEPGLSCLDLIMHHGPESARILDISK